MPRRPRPATRGRRGARAYAVPTVALALSASLVLAVAGCGQPTRSPDDAVAPTVSVAMQPTITPGPSDGSLFDAASSLTSTSCRATGESWSFTGTLTNADSQEHTFTVAVFLVKTSDGSDVASKEVDVLLAAGAAKPVSIKNFHTGPSTGVECLSGVTVKGL